MDNNPKHKDLACYGWDLREIEAPEFTLSYIIDAYKTYQGEEDFFMNGFNLRSGNGTLIEQIRQGLTEEEIKNSWQAELDEYRALRQKYLLYPDTAP